MLNLFNLHDANDNDEEARVDGNAPLGAPDFFLCTNPEMDALERAAADGKHGLNYADIEQQLARVHRIEGASHWVSLQLTEAERALGVDPAMLARLTAQQDADATLAFLYISRLLAPPTPLPPNATAVGWIDFDDVIAKIGWDPRSSAERREMHRRLYGFVLFGERAQVVGERQGRYLDKHTGKTVSTTIRAALWRVAKTELPDELLEAGELFDAKDARQVPVRVEITIDRDWARLLTQPQTAQYLPMGELLGTIPGNKPSGAWGRVIGLALASFWRRQPRAAMEGSMRPTRRELLERYTPKTGPVGAVLRSNNPQDAITFWCAALRALAEREFLAPAGEVLVSPQTMRAALPRKEWGDLWLDETIDLRPGAAFGNTIVERVSALPPVKKKRGRPRKKPG